MDKFIDVIITLAMVALFLFPSLLKSIKEVNKKSVPHVPPRVDEEMPEMEELLHKKVPETPKQEEYFTYETLDEEPARTMTQAENSYVSEPQRIVNKEEENNLLSLEEDEVMKGIIYAEILKRKF